MGNELDNNWWIGKNRYETDLTDAAGSFNNGSVPDVECTPPPNKIQKHGTTTDGKLSVPVESSSSEEDLTNDTSTLKSLTPIIQRTQRAVLSKTPTANSPFYHSTIVLDPPYKVNKFSKSSRLNPSKGKRKVTFASDIDQVTPCVEVTQSTNTTFRMFPDFTTDPPSLALANTSNLDRIIKLFTNQSNEAQHNPNNISLPSAHSNIGGDRVLVGPNDTGPLAAKIGAADGSSFPATTSSTIPFHQQSSLTPSVLPASSASVPTIHSVPPVSGPPSSGLRVPVDPNQNVNNHPFARPHPLITTSTTLVPCYYVSSGINFFHLVSQDPTLSCVAWSRMLCYLTQIYKT